MRTAAKRLKAGRRRGASALEFALVLPLLITIVLGCVDFGRFAYTYIAVSNAAREGAYYAARNGWDSTIDADVWKPALRLVVENELGCHDPGSPFDASKVSISYPTATTIPGKGGKPDLTVPYTTDADLSKRVGVRVTYPFTTIVNWPFLPSNMTLGRTVQMRALTW